MTMLIDFIKKLPQISSVCNDSRKVDSSSVFVAIAGEQNDGHDYIVQAVANGAKAIVYSNESKLPKSAENIPHCKVADAYFAYALLCEYFCGYPAASLDICGISGTNGKTTTAFILHKILTDSRVDSGLVSTVKYNCGDVDIAAGRTTPAAGRLQQLFCRMKANKCTNAVMEVSSHALAQHRCGSMTFKVAAFTNLSGDHLDYHHNMEAYFQAKRILFNEYTGTASTLVINADDPYGQRLIKEFSPSRCVRTFKRGDFFLDTNLVGEYNQANAKCAYLCARALGISDKAARDSIRKFKNAPGRLERFDLNTKASVFVDYAHTDDALLRVLTALRESCKGRLTVVFGCGGDRDKLKRPRMGAAAGAVADKIVVTSDNPRSESPESIIKDILAGIEAGVAVMVEPDRRKAIDQALSESEPGEFILVAGKGHEDYQEINGIRHPFDDREVIQSSPWALSP